MKNKFAILISSVILASLVLAGCGTAQTPNATPAENTPGDTVAAEGHVVPNSDVKLTFNIRGQVAEILVTEGQKVSKGDVLIRLGDREQAQAEAVAAQQDYDEFIRTAALSSAQAWEAYQEAQTTRAEAQLEWEKVDPNSIQDQIDTAQTDVQDKKKALSDAKDDLAKYLDLKDDNPTRRQAEADVRRAEADYNTALRKVEDLQREVDTPRAALDSALAAEAEAKRTYELSRDGANPEKKDVLASRLAAAKDALASYELSAPFDGVVTDVNTSVGELIGPDKFAVQMADFSQWFVETSDLTELEVVNVREGQQVVITPDALPQVTLTGTVVRISQSYKQQGGDILYTVKIRLDDSNPHLRWGMTVQATFNP